MKYNNLELASINKQVKIYRELVEKAFELGVTYKSYNFDVVFGSLWYEVCLLASINEYLFSVRNDVFDLLEVDNPKHNSILQSITLFIFDKEKSIWINSGGTPYINFNHKSIELNVLDETSTTTSIYIDLDTGLFDFYLDKSQVEKLYLTC